MDDFVRIANFGSLMPTNEVTVEFWLKVETVQNQVAFALEPNQDTNRFLAHVPFADGGVYWDFGNWNAGGNGGGRLSYTPPVATTNAWHHWTFVASQSANAMCIYRNGMLETNKTGSQVFTPGAYDLLLGGLSTFCTGGQMDEFRIWNVARSAAEIQDGMRHPLTGAEPGLVAYWKFDEGAGTTAADATGHGQTATPSNGTAWASSAVPLFTPLVSTLAASGVGLDGTNGHATLNGRVNPNGLPTSAWFEWGATTSYGQTTAVTNLGSGVTPLDWSAELSDLTPEVRYHYRVVATNSAGLTAGADETFVPTQWGSALALDGVDDYVRVPDGIWFSNAFTIEAWVYARSYQSWARVLDFGNGAPADNVVLALSEGTTGRPCFLVFHGTDVNAQMITAPELLSLNQWVHLAVTLTNDTATLYVAGVGVVTDTVWAPNPVLRTNNYLGRSNWADPYADALLDDVRLWNVARSPAEIQEGMLHPLTGAEPGLVAYWKFDEGAGTTAADATGHGQTASLSNGTAWVPSGVTIEPLSGASLEARWTAGEIGREYLFGYSVSLSADGNTALVGTATDGVYVFVRSGIYWCQQARLTGADSNFGRSVSLSGDGNTALVHGDVVYVFVRTGNDWSQQAKLPVSGVSACLSGDGNTALLGEGMFYAYVCVRNGTNWSQQATLTRDNPAVLLFGCSVALSGDGNYYIVPVKRERIRSPAYPPRLRSLSSDGPPAPH